MFCIYCGATLPEGTEKCTICGNPAALSSEPEKQPEAVEKIAPAEPEAPAEPPRFTEDISSGEPILPKPKAIESGAEETRAFEAKPEAPAEADSQIWSVPAEYRDGYVYEEYETKPKKKRSLKWLFIVLPIVLAVAGTLTGILVWYNAPMQQLSRALGENDYSAAAQMLPKLSEKELRSVAGQMQAYAETVLTRYNEGEAGYEASAELLDRLKRVFPEAGIDRAAERLSALRASKEAFSDAQKLEEKADTTAAISRYSEVVREDVNFDAAQARIEAIKAAYKAQVLADAQARAEAEDFAGAKAALLNSTGLLGDDAEIAAKLAELEKTELDTYVENLLKTAGTLAAGEDYPGAVQVLEGAAREDDRIKEQIESYKSSYKEKLLRDAAKLAETSQFEDAVAVLEGGEGLLGEDDEIAEKIKAYKDLYPVRLDHLQNTGGENCASDWTASDVYGNTYSNGLSFALYPVIAKTVETEYTPGGKYKLLSGTWVVESDTSDDFIGTVRVYVDGSMVYEQSSLTLSTDPLELNLRIDGAQTVRIEAEGAFGSPRAAGYIYLAGATFRN